MKKRLQGLVAGLLIGIMVPACVVFAKTGTESFEAFYNNIKIYVDGVKIEPKDANGKAVEPFIYNGTTYLPVRAVGEAIGKTVSWDGKTNSVYLGKRHGEKQYMVDTVPAFKSSRYEEYSAKDGKGRYFIMSGEKYANGAVWYTDSYALYNLNGNYTRLSGLLGHIDETNFGDRTINIYKDGVLSETIEVTGEMIPRNISIDITGVLQLKIEVADDDYNCDYAIANMVIE